MKNLRDKTLEIAEIAKACPENLQQICFQALLNNYLESLRLPQTKGPKDGSGAESKMSEKPGYSAQGTQAPSARQEDIKETDLHVKVKKFMQKEGVTIDHLNNLFYKEGDKFLALYDDLKTTRVAESQIRIALLQALVRAMEAGEFEALIDSVRSECVLRKCYDVNNFSAAFKNNKSLFDFTTFDKNTKSVRLSDTGRKKLGDLVKEMQ